MRLSTLVAAILALSSAAAAQTFDAADVHPSPHGARESGLYLHANRLELHGITMLHMVMMAYQEPEEKIFGGPNWLDTDRFEVVAHAESGLNAQTYAQMLQTLLEDRFHLKVRKENKPEPIFVLLPAKRSLLKESATKGDAHCKGENAGGYITRTCQNVTMAYLAENLPGMAPNYFNHPVVDKTGLTGAYDITLKWTGRGQIGAGDADHPSIKLFDYLEKELGIRVEAQTRPTESLVIESVDETPSPNPPGTMEKLPAPVTEFDVAEIKPSKPDTQQRFDMQNGRIQAFGMTFRDLIGFAFNLDDYMLPKDEKWLNSDKFDFVAKADPNVTDGTLQAMVRTFLEDRFHVKSHFEEQPIDVWALTAPKGKGKLRETNGEQHAGCTRTPKDGAFMYSCHNLTMAELTAKLPDVTGAGGYLQDHPLVDLTGLKGSYDFEITWSPPARVYGRTAAGGIPTGHDTVAEAPTGGLTLAEAIDKQLGLKLSVEKHGMPVVVIDHIDKLPEDK